MEPSESNLHTAISLKTWLKPFPTTKNVLKLHFVCVRLCSGQYILGMCKNSGFLVPEAGPLKDYLSSEWVVHYLCLY